MSNKLGRKRRRDGGKSGPAKAFVQLFWYVLDSPAYLSLSAPARAALIEVNRGYNGANNGRIILSERTLAERLNCHRDTARRALKELVDKGFIKERIKGSFRVKFRRASEWRLTDRRCDVTGEQQTQDFQKWQNPAPKKNKTRAENFHPYRPKISTTMPPEPGAAQAENFHHYEQNHRPKISTTSISTRLPDVEGARQLEPVLAAGAETKLPDDWRRNSKLPDERLDDFPADGSIPAFLRRPMPVRAGNG